MLPIALQRNPELLIISALLGLISSIIAMRWAKKKGAPQAPLVLFALSLTAVLAATLVPISRAMSGAGYCTIVSPWDGMLDDSGMLNVALFVPLGFFSTLILRRPVLTIVGATTLSAAIELFQGLIPALSRRCDTSDLCANSLGAIAGSLLAVGVVRYFKAEYNVRSVRKFWVILASTACAISLTAVVKLDWQAAPTMSDSAWTQASDSDQKRGESIARKLLGRDVRINQVRLMNNVDDGGVRSVGMVQFEGGLLYINWDSGDPFHGEFGSSVGQRPLDSLAPISGARRIDEGTATKRARQFARDLAWSAINQEPKTTANGDQSRGFTVSWRERENGVLLPFRLDILIGPTGEIEGFDGNPVRLSHPLPPVGVTESDARGIATSKVSQHKIGSVELLAEQVEGLWIPVWAIGLTRDGSSLGNQDRWVVVIDATKPRVIRTVDPSGTEL